MWISTNQATVVWVIGYREWHYFVVSSVWYTTSQFNSSMRRKASIEEALKAQRREQSRNPIWCSCSNWGWKASSSSFRFFVFCCFLLLLPCTILNQVLYWYTTTRRCVVVVNEFVVKIEFFYSRRFWYRQESVILLCKLPYITSVDTSSELELNWLWRRRWTLCRQWSNLHEVLDSKIRFCLSSMTTHASYYQEEKNRRETNKEKRFRGQLKWS